jgi:hypothetical protein
MPGLPEPGDRMPDVAVTTAEGPSTLYAALRQGRHVLVVSQDAAGHVDLDRYRPFAEIVRARLGHRRAAALVRPDGYLAALGTADDTAWLHDYVTEHVVARDDLTPPHSYEHDSSSSSSSVTA